MEVMNLPNDIDRKKLSNGGMKTNQQMMEEMNIANKKKQEDKKV
jgi:hypothetical protein